MKPTSTVRVKQWTLAEYARVVETGAFAPEVRLELLGGEIIEMTAQGDRHALALGLAQDVMTRIFSSGHHVRVQSPLRVPPDSAPEPDVAVVQGPRRAQASHPTTAVLLVEVADTTLAHDRRKASVYARAGVREYWIVNLEADCLEVHTDPRVDPQHEFGFSYATLRTLKRGESLSPLAAPGQSVAVAELLP
jgi:Uma2 family endonuclease